MYNPTTTIKKASGNGQRKEKSARIGFFLELKKNKILFLMIAPVLIYFVVFSYLPMVGVYFAFTRFNFNDGLFGSPFVGFKNFKFLFDTGTLLYLTKNTILYNIAFILLGNSLSITVAILLSRVANKTFKRLTQSFMFFPFFISYVIVNTFSYAMLNSGTGVFTRLLASVGIENFNAYSTPGIWKYIIVSVYLWKTLGYGTVIYLAAITGISDEYYEAAQVDGATIFQQVRYITIPLLVPTFIILLLLAIGGILRGQFELFYQLVGSNGQLFEATDILDTYVFRMLRVTFDLGIGAAAGLYQSLFGLVLILTVNYVIRKYQEDYALF
ncbi:MAG: ABC transporter permease subunit [Treponemataceae bacterium]